MLEEEYETDRRVLPRHLRKPAPEEAPFSFEVREATEADLADVRELYNHYIANTVVTFDEDPKTIHYWRDRFTYLAKIGFPFLVATSGSGQIIGYAYVNPWNTKAAFRHTGEVSIYLGPASTGKRLGSALLKELIDRSREAGIKELVAVIADGGAETSVALHEKYGFRESGRLGKVGYKFGRWVGTILLTKNLRKSKR